MYVVLYSRTSTGLRLNKKLRINVNYGRDCHRLESTIDKVTIPILKGSVTRDFQSWSFHQTAPLGQIRYSLDSLRILPNIHRDIQKRL
jgi:hypothetical protein